MGVKILNATFHCFKESGKWYVTYRGYLSEDVFRVYGHRERRTQILLDNDGKYPGLSGPGREFIFVVIPDDGTPHGYPLMLKPEGE